MGGKSKLLLVGVFCVSLSVGMASADSYTELMEAVAATLKSAQATLAEARAEFEARATKAAVEAETAKIEAEAGHAKALAVDTGENLPVEQVSWDDVQEFIKRLNVLTGKKYRLPTEAEWEYAARGGARSNGRKFSGHPYLYDVAWYDYNSYGATQPVGTREPNELGVYDMLGNVWEWVGDWYDKYYYRDAPLKNPGGPRYGRERVSRGCSFNSTEGHCRESLRNYNKPDSRTIYLGFRLAQ